MDTYRNQPTKQPRGDEPHAAVQHGVHHHVRRGGLTRALARQPPLPRDVSQDGLCLHHPQTAHLQHRHLTERQRPRILQRLKLRFAAHELFRVGHARELEQEADGLPQPPPRPVGQRARLGGALAARPPRTVLGGQPRTLLVGGLAPQHCGTGKGSREAGERASTGH